MSPTESLPPPPADAQTQPSFVVVIGASAGGIEPLEDMFRSMTQRMGLAFIVIQHLLPDVKHQMVELMSRWTTLAVELAEQDLSLAPDTIYLTPPDCQLTVANGRFMVAPRDRNDTHLIDACMRSCAADYGESTIAVVLSGIGDDGARGVREVHSAGGLVLAQSEETAKFDGMPRSAMETGVVDLAVSPREIPEVIRRHITGRKLDVERPPSGEATKLGGMQAVFSLLQSHYGINFSIYKAGTVTRRIERRIQLEPHKNLSDYIERLQTDQNELEALYRDLLIGVTAFFRDPEAFELLEREIIPMLVTKAVHGPELRLWVAGCATGEEAYSIGILLLEAIERSRQPINAKIFATDAHRPSLDFAGIGLYSPAAVAALSEERIARYFVREEEGFRVATELRRLVVFAQHNVLRDAPFTKLDLISCRNMLIYLQPAAQRKVMSLFHFGLRTHGTLFLGPSETPGDLVEEFEPIDQQWRIYRKRRDLRLLPLPRDTVGQSLLGTNPTRPTNRETHLRDLFGLLLDEVLPPSVLVDREHQIVHTFGDIRALLRLPRGRPSLSLLDLLEGDFKLAVAGALHRAARARAPVSFTDVRGSVLDGQSKYDIRVRPIELPGANALFYLVSLVPTAKPALAREPDVQIDLDQASRDHLDTLETELRQTKENLQATIEELEVSNEELQATNEELLASNEELHSVNEELHSVNEELYTVNAEFQQKIDELTELSDDMNNLLLCTEVHTLFLDQDLAIRKFTPAMADVFHLVATDVGRRIDGFVYNLDTPGLVDLLARVRASGERFEGAVHRQGLTYLMRVLPYRSRGRRAGVVLTLVDVTRLEQVEMALREQVEQRDRFLAMLSHELRNPLAAVSNALHLIERRLQHVENNKIAEPLEMLTRQAAHMQRLLDDLLDVARLTQGKFQLRKTTLELGAVLQEVVKTNRTTLAQHQLSLDQPTSDPVWVFGDATRLVQIFNNLLINAIKYTPAGGHISIELNIENDTAVVCVRDDGAGMDPETQMHIFEPFVQADVTLARSQGGLGVGLTLVHNLVSLHDGTIDVRSEGIGKGSVFTVRLPIVPAPARPTLISDLAIQVQSEARPPRLLVVEDLAEIRETLAELLIDYGFEVTTAPDGRRGLEQMLAAPPDAALLDIGLPGIDGYELARRLRAQPSTAGVPLIAMTGYGRSEDAERVQEAGFDTHLVKPVNMGDLLAALARLGVSPPPGKS